MGDEELLQRFLAGDRAAFRTIVTTYHASLVRVARYYVRSDASAEDVAQEVWIAVLCGADRFEGRSTFKTWLYHIAVNRAKRVGERESRVLTIDPVDPVSRSRFDGAGAWREPPVAFTDLVEATIANAPTLALVRTSLNSLPEPQRSVVTLRDVEGLSTREVADLLELSEANVRVVLHRGRAKVRGDIERAREGDCE